MATVPAIGRKVLRALRGRPRDDARARRVVAVIECVLNQNARDPGAATSAALNPGVLQLCRDHAAGIVQIPCPEAHCLGLSRKRPAGTSIREALDTDAGRRGCRTIGADIAQRLQAYADDGCAVLAVIGGNEHSPGCAVHHGADALTADSGLLMRELQTELRQRGLDPPFVAMRDADPAALHDDLAQLRRLLQPA